MGPLTVSSEIVRRVPLLRKLFVNLSIDRGDKKLTKTTFNETLVN